MTLQQDLERGAKAEALLKDEMLAEAFENTRQAIFQKIEAVPIRDQEGLRELRLMLKLLRDVRANLERAVSDGKLAAAELKIKREGLRERVFR